MSHAWEMAPTGPAQRIAGALGEAIPVIRTGRLILRGPRVTDFEAYASIFMSERSRFMDGPYDRAGAWDDFTEAVAGWLLRGMGVWTITDSAAGTILGFLFLWQEYGDPEPEIGWALVEEAEGRGFALEAAQAVLPHALEQFGPGGVVSFIDPENHASARLAERLGARRDLAAEDRYRNGCHVWRHGLPGTPGAARRAAPSTEERA
jgi:RimJ/RimL family protein N-acetyltransferase